MSTITKKYKKRALILMVVSWLFCFGTFLGLTSVAANRYMGKPEQEVLIEVGGRYGENAQRYIDRAKNTIVTSFVSMIPMAVLSVVAKDKVRPLLWMINIVLGNFLLGSTAMYIVFGTWVADEYALRPMAKLSRSKWVINKEIDKRE